MYMNTEEFRMLRLNFCLHKLINEGKGDGEEADKARDEMDVLWSKIDDTAREQTNDVSCWLYAIHDPENPEMAEKYRRLLFDE